MSYFEYKGNLHMHTPYSDGQASHSEIADAALSAGLDFVIVTDHNILVKGVEGYYGDEKKGHVLLLTGQEIHDRQRLPQVNHCLVYGIKEEMVDYAPNPQTLLDEIAKRDGLAFLAHPFDRRIMWQQSSSSIHWADWNVSGYTGLEIWNYMSSFKDLAETPWKTFRRVFNPEKAMLGPNPATLKKWDELLAQGRRVVGIGNADAHGTIYKLGPLRHTIFPYDFLFNCVNTHILTPQAFVGDVENDEHLIYQALRNGRAFISYGILGSAAGFRFTAQGAQGSMAIMGERIRLGTGVTLQVVLPARSHLKLIYQGVTVAEEEHAENLTYVALKAGAYRVEVWREYKGVERCWILSNPIYIEANL